MVNGKAGIIFAILGGAATVAVPFIAHKDAVKSEPDILELKANGASKKDILLAYAKGNWKTALITSVALACNTTSVILGKRREASLIATVASLDAAYRKYGNKVKEKLGIDVHKDILKDIAKDDYEEKKKMGKIPAVLEHDQILYWENHIGHFLANPVLVAKEFTRLNREIGGDPYENSGIYTLKDFINNCNAKVLDTDNLENRLNFGWTYDYMCEMWEFFWVDAYDIDDKDDNGNYRKTISFSIDPVWNPSHWYEWSIGNTIRTAEYLNDIPEDYLESTEKYMNLYHDESKVKE